MAHTVGIMGANGLVGGTTAKALAQSAKEGKIKLVILHRSGKVPEGYGPGVEMRTLDLDGPASSIEEAVKGINVFISAVGFGALSSEPNLVDALAKSKDLVTYIPSTYSTTWTDADMADPPLGGILNFIESGMNRALAKGVGTTIVYVGCFDIYWFEYSFVGSNLKQNLIWANKTQMQNRIPITVVEHLAQALNDIAVAGPQTMKNTKHSVVTFWPTGHELAELYQKIQGKPAEIRDFTTQDRNDMRADAANFGAAKVGYWDKWEKNEWGYDDKDLIPHETESFQLEAVARKFA